MKKKILKSLASLKLAVVIILGIAVICAYGTIIESRYDAIRAQKLVYHSWWSYLIFGCLIVNLSAVMVDRWPWKKRHIAFLCAHIGIIILLIGSLITRYYGVDGSLRFSIGEKAQFLVLPESEVIIYSSLDGSAIRRVTEPIKVDFLLNTPSKENPIDFSSGGQSIEVVDYSPYAIIESKILPTEGKVISDRLSPAIRFQLQNERVNQVDWILLKKGKKEQVVDLGPAKVVFAQKNYKPMISGKVIYILYDSDSRALSYFIQNEMDEVPDFKPIKAGFSVDTGWMGLKLRLLKVIESAEERIVATTFDYPKEGTREVIDVKFGNKVHKVAHNSVAKFFTNNGVFYFSYGNKRVPLDFSIKLEKFIRDKYPGTNRAASYKSIVSVEDEGKSLSPKPIEIFMNEPLKYKGFTLYQSSFEEDEMGQATASILSVNRDPGRWVKYLGSLLIVWGIIELFYFRPKRPKVG